MKAPETEIISISEPYGFLQSVAKNRSIYESKLYGKKSKFLKKIKRQGKVALGNLLFD